MKFLGHEKWLISLVNISCTSQLIVIKLNCFEGEKQKKDAKQYIQIGNEKKIVVDHLLKF